MEIPARIEQAVSDAVAQHLETELGDRGLLLAAAGLVEAEAEAAQRGARLLTCVVHRCYPISRQGGPTLAVEFENDRDAARLEAALAFGAVTARVLGPGSTLIAFTWQPERRAAPALVASNRGRGLRWHDAETSAVI